MMRNSGIYIVALAALVLMTAGCGKKEQASAPSTTGEKKVRIVLITNGNSPFWDPMEVGMRKAAEELGCEAISRRPTTDSPALQRQIIEEYQAQKVDGIGISVIESDTIGPVIDELMNSGIKVITFDSDAANSKRIAYIGTNNFEAGKAAGEAAKKLLPEGGKVFGFVGNQNAPNARERIAGFKEAIKGTNIVLVDVFDDNKDPAKARANVENVLQAHKDVKMLLGLFSYDGPQIAAAVKEAGVRDKVKILCFDAEPETINHLKRGEIDATVVQKPYEFGYRSVQLLYKIITLGDVDKALKEFEAESGYKVAPGNVIDTGVEIITPQNINDYLKRLEDLGIKSS
ncbi:MAG: sugar-binding protein [Chthonomonadetes bacterium]|nr:sugar-binding protein [Chthonomonadetes bacterium]